MATSPYESRTSIGGPSVLWRGHPMGRTSASPFDPRHLVALDDMKSTRSIMAEPVPDRRLGRLARRLAGTAPIFAPEAIGDRRRPRQRGTGRVRRGYVPRTDAATGSCPLSRTATLGWAFAAVSSHLRPGALTGWPERNRCTSCTQRWRSPSPGNRSCPEGPRPRPRGSPRRGW